ncbi:hypothetical protein BDF22DRAFT_695692 [Syncephalis plumigaleata]|nr:hypothetical protein BDF22DRAFT_695692 [Syncephalis plumigaleata]
MVSIPVLVVERIVLFGDSASLVQLATCSRWLWHNIGNQQLAWRQRYQQRYSFDDDEEVKWMSWYLKAIRLDKKQSSYNNSRERFIRLDSLRVNWFRAFCCRRATEARWLSDSPLPLERIRGPLNLCNTNIVVLQRMPYHRRTLYQCGIIEQCQRINDPRELRFWRLRNLVHPRLNPDTTIEQFMLSDRYIVLVRGKLNNPRDRISEPNNIFVWSVRWRDNTPRYYAFPCNRKACVRGRWMTITHAYGNPPFPETSTRVFDLATGRMCSGVIIGFGSESHLQRVTEDAALVFHTSVEESGDSSIIKWSVWRFSVHQLEDSPRKLMQGSLTIEQLTGKETITTRLDDDRVLVCNTSIHRLKNPKWIMNREPIDLALISTRTRHMNGEEELQSDCRPVWSRYIQVASARPFISSDRLVVMANETWMVYQLSAGVMLSCIDMNTIKASLDEYCSLESYEYLKRAPCYLPGYVFCLSPYTRSYVAVNLMDPINTRKLGIISLDDSLLEDAMKTVSETSRHLKEIIQHSSIGHMARLFKLKGSTRNALLISKKGGLKIIDLAN